MMRRAMCWRRCLASRLLGGRRGIIAVLIVARDVRWRGRGPTPSVLLHREPMRSEVGCCHLPELPLADQAGLWLSPQVNLSS